MLFTYRIRYRKDDRKGVYIGTIFKLLKVAASFPLVIPAQIMLFKVAVDFLTFLSSRNLFLVFQIVLRNFNFRMHKNIDFRNLNSGTVKKINFQKLNFENRFFNIISEFIFRKSIIFHFV